MGRRFTLTIDRLSLGGEGVGRADGMAVFVPYAAPGDRLEVELTEARRRYGRARIVRILEPSAMKKVPYRVGIAFGTAKVQVITAALRGGWINQLVTDEETATRILRKEKGA